MLSPERLDILQTQWVRLLGSLGVEAVAAYPVFDKLVAEYTEPHRFYHNLEHIAEMLKVVGRLGKLATDPVALQFAVWFHDAIYDPKRNDNEERSADFASVELANFYLSDTRSRAIRELILATKHHAASDAADAAVLLDADLAILGSTEVRYARYAEAIRREYAHVPDEAYRSGRTAVLEKFLNRERIFQTDIMFQEAEATARKNLREEIHRLTHNSLPSNR